MDWLKSIRPRRDRPLQGSDPAGADPAHADPVGTAPVGGAAHASLTDADPYAFQVAHRRLAWMLRLSVGTNIVLAACVTSLISMFTVMLPLKSTEIALVRTDPGDSRIYRIEPISEETEGFALLMEMMARRYVQLVLAIDPVTSNERYREASRMTDRALSTRLRRERIDTDEVRDALSDGITREILVESVDAIVSFGSDLKFAVDFDQVDRQGGKVLQRRKIRAFLSMTTRPSEVRAEDRYINPLGITVTDMTLKERGAL